MTTVQSDAARVLIVDDNPYARLGLQLALSDAPEFTIVGEAANGAQAVDMCRTLQPDLVLLDLWMPVMDGAQAASAIKAASPRTGVMVLSATDVPENHEQARAAGADAFLSKDATPDELVLSVRHLLRRRA